MKICGLGLVNTAETLNTHRHTPRDHILEQKEVQRAQTTPQFGYTIFFATIFIQEILLIFLNENEQLLLSSSTVMYETLTQTFFLSLSMRLRSQFQSNTRNYQQKRFYK